MNLEQKKELVFGQPPPPELKGDVTQLLATEKGQRTKKAKKEAPDPYQPCRFLPIFEEALRTDWYYWQERSQLDQDFRSEFAEMVFGPGVEIGWHISITDAGQCLRQVGYKILGEKLGISPSPRHDLEGPVIGQIGSSSHYGFLRLTQRFLEGEREGLFRFYKEPLVYFSGRTDFFFHNPRTGEWQVVEYKTVGNHAFKSLKADKLPNRLKTIGRICSSRPEDYKQVLLYMWAKAQQGYQIGWANIIYINRDSGELKEFMVPWDEKSKQEADQLVEQIRGARNQIDQGILPEPTVESPGVCKFLCDYAHHCDKRKATPGKIGKPPEWAIRRSKEKRIKQTKEIEKAGFDKVRLPGLE